MRIFYDGEDLEKEAGHIAKKLQDVFKFDSLVLHVNLEGVFSKLDFSDNSYLYDRDSFLEFMSNLNKNFRGKSLVITPKDLYLGKQSGRDWFLGCLSQNNFVISTARIKMKDNKMPDKNIMEVTREKYLKRLETITIHEIGHDSIVHPDHYRFFFRENEFEEADYLGLHCPDERCIMFAGIDINNPPRENGSLFFFDSNRENMGYVDKAGLDITIENMYPSLFCKKCLKQIKLSDQYSIK